MTKRTNRAAALRATTPPSTSTMSVSEFVRGGIYNVQTPTVIVNHGTEIGTWMPRGQTPTAPLYASSSSILDPQVSAAAAAPAQQTITFALGPNIANDPQARSSLAEAVEKLHKYLREGTEQNG